MTLAEREAELLLARYEEEPEHVRHVAALADQLFSGLAAWHGYGERERLFLRLAALLHDSGKSAVEGGRGHHLASAELIRAHRWPELSGAEVAVVAQIARYHRKELPAADHPAYAALAEADKLRVARLGGLLRLADALDRSHERRVARLDAAAEGKALRVRVTPAPGAAWTAEAQAAARKKDLLERVAGPVVIE